MTVNGTEPDTYPQGQEPAVFVPRQAAEWLAKQTPKALGLNPSQYPFHAVAFHSDRVMMWLVERFVKAAKKLVVKGGSDD